MLSYLELGRARPKLFSVILRSVDRLSVPVFDEHDYLSSHSCFHLSVQDLLVQAGLTMLRIAMNQAISEVQVTSKALPVLK